MAASASGRWLRGVPDRCPVRAPLGLSGRHLALYSRMSDPWLAAMLSECPEPGGVSRAGGHRCMVIGLIAGAGAGQQHGAWSRASTARAPGSPRWRCCVAVAFWTWLWGPVGLLLATPLTVCRSVLSWCRGLGSQQDRRPAPCGTGHAPRRCGLAAGGCGWSRWLRPGSWPGEWW